MMANGNIYTGSTSNLKDRMSKHNAGGVISTKKYLPIHMLGYEAYVLKSDALRREKFMKTTEGKRLRKQQYRDIINQI